MQGRSKLYLLQKRQLDEDRFMSTDKNIDKKVNYYLSTCFWSGELYQTLILLERTHTYTKEQFERNFVLPMEQEEQQNEKNI